MAELASGAVSSLLGLLREEAQLLDRVGGDVEFIKEMESMQSFLEHLARTAPPGGGGHDEQVRTWMKQVQDLAHDCSNFFDLYLLRGDPKVYRARLSRWRYYVWWASWLVHRLLAQRKAAVRLAELKERARDVGKRRLRYGVEIPAGKDAVAAYLPSSSSQAAAAVEDDGCDDDDDNTGVQDEVADAFVSHHGALEPRALEDYCFSKLDKWLQQQANRDVKVLSLPSIAIVVPDDAENAEAIRSDSLNWAAGNFTSKVRINLPAVHLPGDLPLLPWEILAYILRQCKPSESSTLLQDEEEGAEGAGDEEEGVEDPNKDLQWQAYRYKGKLSDEIEAVITGINVYSKTEEIETKIEEIDRKTVEESLFQKKRMVTETKDVIDKRLGVLLLALRLVSNVVELGVPVSSEEAVQETAGLLKSHIEGGDQSKPHLTQTQYENILRKVFPTSKAPPPPTTDQEAGKDHIITTILENHRRTLLDIIRELVPRQQQLVERSSGNGKPDSSSAAAAAIIKETDKKMEEISGEVNKASSDSIIATAINEAKEKVMYDIRWDISYQIEDQLFITVIADKIKTHLKNKKTLIILQDDEDYISQWEETIKGLNLLGCANGSAVIVSTRNSGKAKQFCYPTGEPITCSLVGLYHDIVLQLTKQRENDKQILRDILDKCYPHEFCMKIFAQALHANPKRSYEELQRLHQDLVAQQKTLGSNAKRMLKFSYKDLPREHKTCLLYLAIFPQGYTIRRSTIIGRWVAEGLITKENWCSAVRHAERCFDSLIKRGLVLPRDIGAAGKVKSCMVGHEVHGFITKIANKEHILDARLSDLWARHFSIFSGLRLRASDSIDRFVQKLPRYSPQLPLLKVLDLEGCNCFEKSYYLKDICKNILLLKYLSLRGTNVAKLPTQINNLHELEVLDIRQTNVPESATRDVLLLKLKRLLASRVDPSSRLNDKPSCSAVQIPSQIEKMDNLEVLSNVKASRHGCELEGIRHLWQLRKLGVVIEDKQSHISYLLRAITDLHGCLQSLSITIPKTRKSTPLQECLQSLTITIPNIRKSTPSSKGQEQKDRRQTLKNLESLSINGVTQKVKLLHLVTGSNELAKVTLSGTLLEQEDLTVLGVLPKLRCLRFQSNAYNGSKLTFREEEFPCLKYFLVEGARMTHGKMDMAMTDIKFEDEATVELEKVVLSFTNIRSLSGIGNLPKLKELELEGNHLLHSFSQDPEKSRAVEPNTDSGASKQNTESKIPKQRTFQIRAPDENTENIAPEQNIESKAHEQNTKSRAAEPNTHSRASEQNSESSSAGQNTQSRDPTESRAPEKNTQSKAPEKSNTQSRAEGKALEQNTDSIAPEQNTESKAPEQNTEIRAAEQTTGSRVPEQNSEIRSAEQNSQLGATEQTTKSQTAQSRASEQNTEIGAPDEITESKFIFKKGEFQHLMYFRVKDFRTTKIIFENEAAPELKKIDLALDDRRSELTGVNGLEKLREIELRGNKFLLSFFDIAKVTLHDTQLKQADIQILAKKRNLRCLVLSDKSYEESQLVFEKDDFPNLDLLVVECPNIDSISFADGSAANLKKIVWTTIKMKSLSGINNLLRLKEIEYFGDLVPWQVRKDITAHTGKPVLTHKKPQ